MYCRASIKTVNDLFNKTVAIDAADISPDLMMKMIMELDEPGTESPNTEEEQSHEVTQEKSSSIFSWSNLKTTLVKSITEYREDFGKGFY